MKAALKLLSFVLLVVAIILAGIFLRKYIAIEKLDPFLKSLGVWGPVIFIGLYIFATVLFLPGSILTLTGGFVFGPWLGTAYSITGAVIGASIAFLIARFIASSWVEQKVGGSLKQLKEGVEAQGWKFVAVVRLIPLIPFNMLNYALGLTRVSLPAYAIASFVFMLPGCFAYTYLGHLGQSALTGRPGTIVKQAFVAIGLLVIVAIIPWVIKTLRNQNGSK